MRKIETFRATRAKFPVRFRILLSATNELPHGGGELEAEVYTSLNAAQNAAEVFEKKDPVLQAALFAERANGTWTEWGDGAYRGEHRELAMGAADDNGRDSGTARLGARHA